MKKGYEYYKTLNEYKARIVPATDKPVNPLQQNEQKVLFNLFTSGNGATNRDSCDFTFGSSANNQSNAGGSCCFIFPFSVQNNNAHVCFSNE